MNRTLGGTLPRVSFQGANAEHDAQCRLRRREINANNSGFRVLVGVVDSPDACASAEVQNSFDFGVGLVWRGEAERVVKREEKEVMLQVLAISTNRGM